MSGGVDSSASAVILKQKGYEVIGVTMKLWDEGCLINHANDAKKVCDKLNIGHHILECQNKFKEHVVNDFIKCYECGKTPNPCVECNKYLKFGELYKKALELTLNTIDMIEQAILDKLTMLFVVDKMEIPLTADASS